MTTTSPRVAFGLYALTIKQDSTPSCSDVQSFSKVTDLKTGNVTSRPYITYEPDFWLLDGGYKFKPVNNAVVHVGLMSLSMSNNVGAFTVPPVLQVTFSTLQTTDGLTLRFSQYSNDYAASITVAFYDGSDVLIRSDPYSPAAWEFSTAQAVANFKKILITFNTTNKSYRYLRLTGIDFGELTYFEGEDIKSATMVQEVNPLSVELSIDTFDLSLFSSDATFSIIAPSGEYAQLQNKQPLDVYENVDNNSVYLGQFYLDRWENVSDNEIKFYSIDRIGLLEGLTYLGGIWVAPVNVEDLIDEIMTAINTPYELDTELYGVEVVGWIPVTTYREALQQIAFAVGAYVTCARSGVVRIFKTYLASSLTSFEANITRAEKGLNQSLTLKPLVTGVEVTGHNYIENAISTQLYNGTLAAGSHTITFSAPKHDLQVTGASIASSGANYAILNVATPGTVTLDGEGYDDTKQVLGIHNLTLDPNVPKNILSISDATLVHNGNIQTVTQRVYDYYQQRYLQKVKLYAPSVEPGRSTTVETLYNQQIGGVIEKMTLDLTGGYTSQTEIVGVVIE